MDIKNRFLSKSNSYNYYKEKYEEYKEKYEAILEENSKLKDDYKYSSNIRRSEYLASTFCDTRFHDYCFSQFRRCISRAYNYISLYIIKPSILGQVSIVIAIFHSVWM